MTEDTLQHASVLDHVDGRTSLTGSEDAILAFHMLDAYLVIEPLLFTLSTAVYLGWAGKALR